jgi:carbamoyltransferase
MTAILNGIKGRESYRPVAPICLEERAADIFEPGERDPYMVFDHRVRPDWAARIPAVVHVDGTARLQTVSDRDSPLAASVLRAFAARSGIPVLCNTSANLPGRGFFPDAASAMSWGGTSYVWADGVLYTREEPGGAP